MSGNLETAIGVQYRAFRNALVYGQMDMWYEGTSQTTSGYGSDTMWRNENVGSTKVHTRQTLSQTDIPDVPTATYYSRTVVTSVAGASNYCFKYQWIPNAATFPVKL